MCKYYYINTHDVTKEGILNVSILQLVYSWGDMEMKFGIKMKTKRKNVFHPMSREFL